MSTSSRPRKASPVADKGDLREQLFNDKLIGPVQSIQLPAEAITRLHGVLFDVDPEAFREDVAPQPVRSSPTKFYQQVVRPWLDRHPTLSDAEIRDSGRGLHIILRFDEPVTFASDSERMRWSGIVKSVQAVLPSDPRAPGITAVTRALGSTNGKTGTFVKQLAAGMPVPASAVAELFGQLRLRPFQTVTRVLFGCDRVRPCPICRKGSSSMVALDRVGACYSCGKVSLGKLYSAFLATQKSEITYPVSGT